MTHNLGHRQLFFNLMGLAFMVAALFVSACSDEDSEFRTIVDDSLLFADTSEICIYNGEIYPSVTIAGTLQLIYYGDGSPEWVCSNSRLADVNRNGLVLGLSEGLVTITATVTGKHTETISNIDIYVIDGGIEVVMDNSLLTADTDAVYVFDGTAYPCVGLGETLQLLYSGAGEPVWRSGDESVATVDGNGLVLGLSEGLVTISATVTDGNNIAASNINIYVIPL